MLYKIVVLISSESIVEAVNPKYFGERFQSFSASNLHPQGQVNLRTFSNSSVQIGTLPISMLFQYHYHDL